MATNPIKPNPRQAALHALLDEMDRLDMEALWEEVTSLSEDEVLAELTTPPAQQAVDDPTGITVMATLSDGIQRISRHLSGEFTRLTRTGVLLLQHSHEAPAYLDAHPAPQHALNALQATGETVVIEEIRTDGEALCLALRWLAAAPQQAPEIIFETADQPSAKAVWDNWDGLTTSLQRLRVQPFTLSAKVLVQSAEPLLDYRWEAQHNRLLIYWLLAT